MTIIRNLLQEQGIEAVEAGGRLAPAQNAFCSKICSKIINAQFCVVLLNNDTNEGSEQPNANVNMEYGLMLGFNKYIIPFQRESQNLPFNVATLDTVKYEDRNFEQLAANAINQAIIETQLDTSSEIPADQPLEAFLLTKKLMMSPISSQGEDNIFQLGRGLEFNLLNDFAGMNYTYFGNFTSLRPEAVIWRTKTLVEILDDRRSSLGERVRFEIATQAQVDATTELMEAVEILILVTSDSDKADIQISPITANYPITVISLHDISSTLTSLEFAEDGAMPGHPNNPSG